MPNPVREFLTMYDEVSHEFDDLHKRRVIANLYAYWHDCRDCGDVLEDFNVYESVDEMRHPFRVPDPIEGPDGLGGFIDHNVDEFLEDYGLHTMNPDTEIRVMRHLAQMLDRVDWAVCWLDREAPDASQIQNLDDYVWTMNGETADETEQTFTFHVVNDVVTEVV